MTTTETDVRRMRLLQIVEVAATGQIGSRCALDALRGQHFRVTGEAFQADLAQLEASGFVETSPLGEGVRITLTGAGRQVIDLVAQPPAPPHPVSVDLGRGAHLCDPRADQRPEAGRPHGGGPGPGRRGARRPGRRGQAAQRAPGRAGGVVNATSGQPRSGRAARTGAGRGGARAGRGYQRRTAAGWALVRVAAGFLLLELQLHLLAAVKAVCAVVNWRLTAPLHRLVSYIHNRTRIELSLEEFEALSRKAGALGKPFLKLDLLALQRRHLLAYRQEALAERRQVLAERQDLL